MYHLVNMDHPYYDNPQQHCELMTVNINSLIAEVQARSVLWDRRNLYYTDRFIKRAAWQEVYKALNPNFDQLPKLQQLLIGNAIERRWRSLREGFSKRVRHENQLTVRRAPYIYHQQLDFLRKVIVIKNSSNNPDNEDCVVDSQSSPKHTTLEEKLVKFLETQSQAVRDDHQNFFDSLLPSVRKFDEQQALGFRAQVLSLVHEMRSSTPDPSETKDVVSEESSDSSIDDFPPTYEEQPQIEHGGNTFVPPVSEQALYVSQGCPSSTCDSGVDSPMPSTSCLIQSSVHVAMNMEAHSEM